MQLSVAFLVAYVIFMEKFRGLKPKGVSYGEVHHPHVASQTQSKTT